MSSLASYSDLWISFVTESGLSDRYFFVAGTWLLNFVLFWSYNTLLFVSYKLQLCSKYLIQPDLKPPEELVWRNVVETLLAQFIGMPILIYFLFPLFSYFGMSIRDPIPDWSIICRDLFIALATTDTLGYWGHRFLHDGRWYKYIHKHHHEYKVNVGIANVFAHPLEDLFHNTWSSIAGCLFMGSHVLVLWLWLSIRILEAINAHSGYHFLPYWMTDWFSGGAFHEFHHSHNIGNYGAFTTIWDKICGTDVAWRQYMKQKKQAEKEKMVD